ncbi:unnamed protein product [Calicophoron daubneyi]|uniref:Breast cancer metastasis-suppressor 1-like protein n=1 Tax=Calicophoron daubneyi TaxID=300641 RepID=A0AAV2T1N2_CALDB
MSTDDSKNDNVVNAPTDEDAKRTEEDLGEQENRSELGEEDLTDAEIEALRRELAAEVSELEWEFKHAKEMLYNERISQVENKLEQARSGTAAEFLHVVSLVEETYRIRQQVAKCRMDFAMEVADKEVDNELQIARCAVTERLQVTEDQIRLRLQEDLCRMQVERIYTPTMGVDATPSHRKTRSTDNQSGPFSTDRRFGADPNHRSILSQLDSNLYLPSLNLEPRKKPVSLSPTAPRLIYQLPEEEIRADVEAIMAAVKEHKLALAMAEMSSGKRVC